MARTMEHSMSEEVSSSAQSFDFEGHRRQAMERYQKVRPLYAAFAETIHSIVKESLTSAGLKFASIEWRAKDLESFGDKASQPSPDDPEKPKYSDPVREITDLAGVRIITFFPRTIRHVDSVIHQ
jgi:putative GTP pyrophosphokinase